MAGVLGTPVHLSAPSCDPTDVTKRQRLGGDLPEADPPDSEDALDSRRFLFCEFFAGAGALTSAVSAAGVPVRSPEDLAGGGIDFLDKSAVDALRDEFSQLATSGVKCMIHFAPPCSTFSRARDRSSKTRLRSADYPQGLPRFTSYTREVVETRLRFTIRGPSSGAPWPWCATS